jgi:hypothetical protein
MKILRLVFCVALLAITQIGGRVWGQKTDSLGAYCNVFYIESRDLNVLPFQDLCFIVDQYTIHDPTNFRAVGPIKGLLNLFDRYDWVMHFYSSIPKENQRMLVAMPTNIYATDIKMKPGQFFVTVSDNRNASRIDPVVESMDFVSVSGSAKVLEYKPQTGAMRYPEYNLQIDLRFRKVERESGLPKLVGEPVRVTMLAVVKDMK